MANILDELDVIKNIESIYDSNSSFEILKDFERVLDDLDLYVYNNWQDGELAEGPIISRHWVKIKFFWPKDKMPDPMGAKRLIDYDCKVSYRKSYIIKPRKIYDPSDFRTGTKKGKLERHPIWIVEIAMPKKVIADIYGANLESLELTDLEQTQNLEPEDETAPITDTNLEGGV